eukprot:TRINITY_DN773_c0_g1_i2.p1 TRINITY_DN773_c0_g1~~TRINITY_DN773_c0_g1_i2.p1  ORF type:complete len:279 (-),score=5.88 TRINITY_DN773_c0_g1_i2:608-1390(-)
MRKIMRDLFFGELLGCNSKIHYSQLPVNYVLALTKANNSDSYITQAIRSIKGLLRDPSASNKLLEANLYYMTTPIYTGISPIKFLPRITLKLNPTLIGIAMKEETLKEERIKHLLDLYKLSTLVKLPNERVLSMNLPKWSLLPQKIYANALYSAYTKETPNTLPILGELKSPTKGTTLFVLEPKKMFQAPRQNNLEELILFSTRSYWEGFYQRKQKPVDWYCSYKELASHILPYMNKADCILQIGCGNSSTLTRYKNKQR